MGILILAKDNANYDPTTKTYTFTLERQLQPEVTQFRIESCTFIPSTVDTYPHAVYMCSKTISRLCKKRHVTELVSNHLDRNTILAVLHKDSRSEHFYVLKAPLRIDLTRHNYVKEIDIFFTDLGGTKLDGVYTPAAVPGISESQMEAHVTASDITVWLDMAATDAVLNASLEQASVDESINRIISRVPGGALQLMASGVDKVKYTTLGSGKAVTQADAAAWSYSIDGSGNPYDVSPAGSHIFLLRSPQDASNLEVIWQSSSLHLYYWGDTLQYKTGSPEVYRDSGLVVLNDTDYLLEVKYTATESNWYLTKLSNNTTLSALNEPVLRSPTFSQVKMISTAQSHQLGKFGDYINCMPDVAADVVTYFKQIYNGEATQVVVVPNAVDASWVAEFRTNA